MREKLTSDQLILKYQEMPDKEKVNILFEAIVKQKMYPDHQRYDCIFMAMGYADDHYGFWTKNL